MPSPDPVAAFNERVKLRATSLNAIGLGVVAYGAIRPLIDAEPAVALWRPLGGLALHACAHHVLGALRKGARR